MNRQQAKDMLPIIQALAEGKHIQSKNLIGNWIDVDFIDVELCNPNAYRVKPEPKYRPFFSKNECWQEMQKHQPLGWLKDKRNGNFIVITSISYLSKYKQYIIAWDDGGLDFKDMFDTFTFIDGSPFGVKE